MNVVCPLQRRKKRGQGAERREEILRAAQLLFLEEGFEHATMRRIAASVGVSATALYVYFPDKDSILRAIAQATFDELLGMLERSQDPALPALERFRAGLRCYVAFGLARPDAYRLTFLAKAMSSAAARPLHEMQCDAADRSFAIMERIMAELMEAGVFAAGSPTLCAEAVWACLHGVTSLLLDQRAHVTSDPDALVEAVLTLAINGNRKTLLS